MVGRRERAGSARRAAKRWFVRTAADSRAAAPPWPPVGRYCGGQRGGGGGCLVLDGTRTDLVRGVADGDDAAEVPFPEDVAVQRGQHGADAGLVEVAEGDAGLGGVVPVLFGELVAVGVGVARDVGAVEAGWVGFAVEPVDAVVGAGEDGQGAVVLVAVASDAGRDLAVHDRDAEHAGVGCRDGWV